MIGDSYNIQNEKEPATEYYEKVIVMCEQFQYSRNVLELYTVLQKKFLELDRINIEELLCDDS